LLTGLAMAALGTAYTIGVRQTLFIRSSLETPSSFVELPVLGNLFNVVENARRAAIHLLNPSFEMVFLIHLGYLLVAVFFAWHWQAVRARYLAAFLLVAAMLGAVPVFGFFDETRDYIYLVPMLLAFDLALRGKIIEWPARPSSGLASRK
jgi:hypothetical protein